MERDHSPIEASPPYPSLPPTSSSLQFRWLWGILILAGGVHLAWDGWARPGIQVTVTSKKPEAIRLLVDYGDGFLDRVSLDRPAAVGTHQYWFPLPADARSVAALELAPTLLGGPIRVHSVSLGFPGLEKTWDQTTGFADWAPSPDAATAWGQKSELELSSGPLPNLLYLKAPAERVDFTPRLAKKRMLGIACLWLVVIGIIGFAGGASVYSGLTSVCVWLSHPENLFLAIGPISVALFLAWQPPFQPADEPNHFLRAWLLSRGQFFPETVEGFAGGTVPRAYVTLRSSSSELHGAMHLRWDEERTQFLRNLRVDLADQETVKFPAVGIHSCVPYIPQAIGLRFATLVTNRAEWHVLGGRSANALVALLLTWFAIRQSRRFAPVIAAVALLPMSLHQMSTLSTDAVTNAICLWTLSRILAWREAGKTRLSARDLATLVAATTALVWCKSVFVAWPILLGLVPSDRFPGRSRQCRWVLIAIGLAITSLLVWNYWVRAYWPDPHHWTRDPVSRSRQLAFVCSNPRWFLEACGRLMYESAPQFATQIAGTFGWLSIPLPMPATLLAWCLLAGSILGNRGGSAPEISTWQRGLTLSVALVSLLLTGLGLYLWWSPVGAFVVHGIQGRYFLSILPLAAVVFDHPRLPNMRGVAVSGFYQASAWVVLESTAISVMCARFYGN